MTQDHCVKYSMIHDPGNHFPAPESQNKRSVYILYIDRYILPRNLDRNMHTHAPPTHIGLSMINNPEYIYIYTHILRVFVSSAKLGGCLLYHEASV